MLVRPLYSRKFIFFNTLTKEAQDYLVSKVPFYKQLSHSERKAFQFRVYRFLDSHTFVGQSIEVTQEMKLLIAAMAVQLTFGLKNYMYDLFHTIIVYPTSYRSTLTDAMHDGEANPNLGILVFSWEEFAKGIRVNNDNLNLGLHEFMHGLHFSFIRYVSKEGASFLGSYETLLELCTPELIEKMKIDSYVRPYAFTNSFELLSVFAECFFESPYILKQRYPSVYQQYVNMLNLDLVK
jgi:MtfA peptidase